MILSSLTLGCSEEKGKYFEHTSNPLSNSIKINYTLSKYDEQQDLYIDELNEAKIDPNKTVLVIIDLYRLNYLDPVITGYINPLIHEVDSLGFKVLYAPSGGPQHRQLSIIDNGIHIYNMDMMDKFILDYEIENLVYIGFDALYCVLDKPNGIYSYLSRNEHNVRMFVMEEGIRSYTEEMKKTALELLKKNNIGVINTNALDLSVNYPNKTNADLLALTKEEVPPGKDFVILFKKEEADREFLEFEIDLKKNRVEYAVVTDNQLYYKEKPISSYDFIKLFHKLEVTNLYYAGYYLNNEILWSDYGLISMYIKRRYNAIEVPNLYLINDFCYIAPGQNILPEIEKYTIVNHYRGVNNILSTSFIEGVTKKSNELKQESTLLD